MSINIGWLLKSSSGSSWPFFAVHWRNLFTYMQQHIRPETQDSFKQIRI